MSVHSAGYSLEKVEPKVPESAQYQAFDVQTDLHTQEVTGSSPVVSTKKNLISYEIRFFSLLFTTFLCLSSAPIFYRF